MSKVVMEGAGWQKKYVRIIGWRGGGGQRKSVHVRIREKYFLWPPAKQHC